jgi:NADH dehydrogenase
MNKNIIIAGGGFAGITALEYLSKNRKRLPEGTEILLIDKKKTSDFLPLIPDVLAGWLSPSNVSFDLSDFCEKKKCKHIQGNITKIDASNKAIYVNGYPVDYEYLLIATGGETNFFGNKIAEQNCFRMNSLNDVIRVKQAISEKAKTVEQVNLVVIGGGYTGLEAAFNSHFYMKRNKIKGKITIVEKMPDIMMMVPAWMRSHIRKQIEKQKMELLVNTSLISYENDNILLDSGRSFNNAICIWTAGVKTAAYLESYDAGKIKTRIKTDEYLKVPESKNPNIFFAGDTAAFVDTKSGQPLRMAIIFAIGQGKIAAINIIRSVNKEPLQKFKPSDPGFIVPLVYADAPGIVFGKRVKGFLGYSMHYFMSIYRSYFPKKIGIIKDLICNRMLNIC